MPSMAPPYTNFLGGPVFWGQVKVLESLITKLRNGAKQITAKLD